LDKEDFSVRRFFRRLEGETYRASENTSERGQAGGVGPDEKKKRKDFAHKEKVVKRKFKIVSPRKGGRLRGKFCGHRKPRNRGGEGRLSRGNRRLGYR